MKSLITHACTAAVCFVAGAVAAVLGLAFLVPDAPAAQPTAYHHAARWA